jgi:nucleotide-binding universal stress UspA family protein
MAEMLYSPESFVLAFAPGGDLANVLQVSQVLQEKGAQAKLLHVLSAMPASMEQVLFPYAAMGLDEDAIWSEILDVAREQLLGELRSLQADSEQAPPSFELRRGDVVEELAAYALKQGSELLLCGGRRKDTGETLGPTAERLLRRLHCPVLLVKRGVATQVKRVLIALGGGDDTAEVLQWGLSFACWLHADVELVSVLATSPEHWARAILENERSAPLLQEAERVLRERVQAILDGITVPFALEPEAAEMKLQLHVRRGDPAIELGELCSELNAEVLVMGRGGRGGRLGRVCLDASARVSAHVLVIPGQSR